MSSKMRGEKKAAAVKRKGLGGLSREKKQLLKQLIMQKAAEDLKKQQERAAEEKERCIQARLPKLSIEGLDQKQLDKKVQELYDVVCRLEEEKYDWEMKLIRQNFEIAELNIKVNDIKGHFVKPVLKKVSKAEQKLAKFEMDKTDKSKTVQSFRENLKSTGQSKFAIEDKEEQTVKKPEWGREQLKHKEDEDKKEEKESTAEEEEDDDDDE